LSFSVALNAITNNATCTVAFVVIGAIINFIFSSIQTLDRISFIGWIGLVSIMASIITLAVSVGVGGRPADAPQEGPFEITTYVVKEVGFVDAINAVSVVVLAYAGTPNFLNIVGEMRDQRSKSLGSIGFCKVTPYTSSLGVSSIISLDNTSPPQRSGLPGY
jgi:amino acid permease